MYCVLVLPRIAGIHRMYRRASVFIHGACRFQDLMSQPVVIYRVIVLWFEATGRYPLLPLMLAGS